jgi:hypothetical protein
MTPPLCGPGPVAGGIEVHARGRIKADVVEQFRAAGN